MKTWILIIVIMIILGIFNENDFLDGISLIKNKENYLIYKWK